MEDFVTYEQAVKLKELGFDWWGDYIYDIGKLYPVIILSYNYKVRDNCYPAPTLAQAQKWLREIKNIDIIVTTHYNSQKVKVYDVSIYNNEVDIFKTCFNTYEQALSTGIDAALEFLKKNE